MGSDSIMIELLWPWAFAVLPLPYLIYKLMPPAARQEAALQVPFYPQATSFEGTLISDARRLLFKKILMVIAWLSWCWPPANPDGSGLPSICQQPAET